jgi:hypothetical protein
VTVWAVRCIASVRQHLLKFCLTLTRRLISAFAFSAYRIGIGHWKAPVNAARATVGVHELSIPIVSGLHAILESEVDGGVATERATIASDDALVVGPACGCLRYPVAHCSLKFILCEAARRVGGRKIYRRLVRHKLERLFIRHRHAEEIKNQCRRDRSERDGDCYLSYAHRSCCRGRYKRLPMLLLPNAGDQLRRNLAATLRKKVFRQVLASAASPLLGGGWARCCSA